MSVVVHTKKHLFFKTKTTSYTEYLTENGTFPISQKYFYYLEVVLESSATTGSVVLLVKFSGLKAINFLSSMKLT